MKKRKLLVVLILVIFMFVIACSPAEQTVPKAMPEADAEKQSAPVETSSGNVIKITASGFEPKTLTIKAGATITFVNEDANKHWPASAMHPSHAVYPGSGIEKCGTAEEINIFDACEGLAQGESFSFVFNEKGSWKYHDHLNVPSTGTIVVE